MDYLLCYCNSNSNMKVINYLGLLSLMLSNGIVRVLDDLKFYFI